MGNEKKFESVEFKKFSEGEILRDRKLHKKRSFQNRTVIINGFNGSGKTLFAPLVSAMPNVELLSFKYDIEWASALLYTGHLSSEGFKAFVQMTLDCHVYDQSMSREVNMRPSDLSSAFKSQKVMRYLKRLFSNGDDSVVKQIIHQKPINCLVTCHLLPVYPTLFEALADRLLFVETIRDPLLMFEQLLILQKEVMSNRPEKDFTFRVSNGFSNRTYCDMYSDETVFDSELSASHEENLLLYLERMFKFYFHLHEDERYRSLVFIPFEKVTADPLKYLHDVAEKLGTSIDRIVRREMKKQRVPRQLLSQGLKLPIYEKYSSFKLQGESAEAERILHERHVQSLMENKQQFARLKALSEEYLEWSSRL